MAVDPRKQVHVASFGFLSYRGRDLVGELFHYPETVGNRQTKKSRREREPFLRWH
jgi:hypothetical protein